MTFDAKIKVYLYEFLSKGYDAQPDNKELT